MNEDYTILRPFDIQMQKWHWSYLCNKYW